MKSYRCHKVVQAAKIVDLKDPDEHRARRLVLEDFGEITVHPHQSQFKNATVGGYYVVYEDGYASYSPAEAFEKGYTEITEDERTPEAVAISQNYNNLILAWTTEHQKPMPWSKSVECYAIVAKLPDEEKQRLLALG